jgi:hypothetical protein
MSSDPDSWKEAKAIVLPGKIYDYRRGYRVSEAGQHENEQQFRAFQVYLNLGAQRSLENTSRLTGHSNQALGKWSETWNWQRRVAQWDKEQIRKHFAEANKIERSRHRKAIEEFRKSNEEQAKTMMEVSNNLMDIIQQRLDKAQAEGEDIPMHLVSGLMRAAANISEQGRQAWATSLGVNELMQVVDQEIEEVEVEEVGDDPYEIPVEE